MTICCAAGENAGEAVEGLAAHDHRAAHGQLLEAPEIARDVPGSTPSLPITPLMARARTMVIGGRAIGWTFASARGFAKP